jgi:putative redox protein
MQFTGTVSSGHTPFMAAEDDFGGKNAGFRSRELLLVGFGGCSGMEYPSSGKNAVTSPASRFMSGGKTEDVPKVDREGHIEYVIQGTHLEKEAVERAIALSLEKYCSVGATLVKTGTITHSYTILKARHSIRRTEVRGDRRHVTYCPGSNVNPRTSCCSPILFSAHLSGAADR